MEFRADTAIYHVGQGSTIEHAHVILMLEALDLVARHTLRHRLVPYVHRVIHPRMGSNVSHTMNEYILGRRPMNSTIGFPLWFRL